MLFYTHPEVMMRQLFVFFYTFSESKALKMIIYISSVKVLVYFLEERDDVFYTKYFYMNN